MKKKRGLKPTRIIKELISSKGLRAENWLVLRKRTDHVELVHKLTGSLKTIRFN
ncbi:DUF6906 family protein [Carnobacterium maltaromaticum]|uniref:DUF6906 family protein n=1 Tax=Carnobacterium maltaromaticum TaxID=2751 RepID=UPI0039BE637C